MLLAIAALALVVAGVVAVASPYAPAAAPAPEDLEEIWEIEDTREASDAPLVTALEMNGAPLAYDAESSTFYCTLGMDNGEAWPQISLTAPDAEDVQLVFVDDYTYDWCSDAIRDGYAYEVIAYTEEAYSYFSIVFTGLPQLCIYTDGQEITTEDTNVRVTVADGGEAALDTTARTHLRGASTLLFDKKNYRVEFTRERNGESTKTGVFVPGFGVANDLVLLPCWNDETKMRDRLSWDLWNELAVEGESFGARRTAYAEVFVDNAYVGLYLMIEPVDVEAELAKAGSGHLETDSVYRTATLSLSRDRESYAHPHRANAGYELYYAPPDAQSFEERFAGLNAYIELTKIEDDEEFAARALEIIDMDNMLRYVLLMQGAAICDNFFNNMYIWAQQAPDGGVTYRFSLWDLDMSWGLERDEIGEEYQRWLFFPVADRMLNLDVGGIRQKAYDMWQEMRAGIFSMEALEARLEEYSALLEGSGALVRDLKRWAENTAFPDTYEFITFAAMRWPLIDKAMELLVTTDGPVDFLSQTQYEGKAGDLFPAQGEHEE
ncbi:MAG: CotH kinase family protein [Candidatus Ventricola sp.]